MSVEKRSPIATRFVMVASPAMRTRPAAISPSTFPVSSPRVWTSEFASVHGHRVALDRECQVVPARRVDLRPAVVSHDPQAGGTRPFRVFGQLDVPGDRLGIPAQVQNDSGLDRRRPGPRTPGRDNEAGRFRSGS